MDMHGSACVPLTASVSCVTFALKDIHDDGLEVWIARNSPGDLRFNEVTLEVAMGRSSSARVPLQFSPLGREEKKKVEKKKTAAHGVITVVPNQGSFFGVTDAKIQQALEKGEMFKSGPVRQMATNGKVHPAVKLGLVKHGDASHPAQVLADHLRMDATLASNAYVVYSNAALGELEVLGFVGGKVWTGKEYEDANAANVQNPLAELNAFDLNGSLMTNGGFIDDTHSKEANEAMLVLDWSDAVSGNEFQHLAGSTVNLLIEDTAGGGGGGGGGGAAAGAGAAAADGPRAANVTALELMVDGFPRIVIVTIRSVAANDELVIDYGQAQDDIAKRVYKKARHQAELNNTINQQLNKIDELHDDVNGYIPRHREDQEQLLVSVIRNCYIHFTPNPTQLFIFRWAARIP